MKRLLLVTLCLGLASLASAQSRSPRHSLDYPGDEAGNRTINKIDGVLPKARVHKRLITCGDGVSSNTNYHGPYIASFRGLAADDDRQHDHHDVEYHLMTQRTYPVTSHA